MTLRSYYTVEPVQTKLSNEALTGRPRQVENQDPPAWPAASLNGAPTQVKGSCPVSKASVTYTCDGLSNRVIQWASMARFRACFDARDEVQGRFDFVHNTAEDREGSILSGADQELAGAEACEVIVSRGTVSRLRELHLVINL
jgi:hypothetical protein